MIKIINLRNEKPLNEWDIRVDRGFSTLANLYNMISEKERNVVCNKYDNWFKRVVLVEKDLCTYKELLKIEEIYKQYNKLNLFCWCYPKRCHAETIKNYLLTKYSIFA